MIYYYETHGVRTIKNTNYICTYNVYTWTYLMIQGTSNTHWICVGPSKSAYRLTKSQPDKKKKRHNILNKYLKRFLLFEDLFEIRIYFDKIVWVRHVKKDVHVLYCGLPIKRLVLLPHWMLHILFLYPLFRYNKRVFHNCGFNRLKVLSHKNNVNKTYHLLDYDTNLHWCYGIVGKRLYWVNRKSNFVGY